MNRLELAYEHMVTRAAAPLIKVLRRVIVKASPTCTLWKASLYGNFYEFRLHNAWKISELEIHNS